MTVLASGSKGNATIVAAGQTRLLVDAGLSCRELTRRMAMVGEEPASLSAILITHEHLDHVNGLSVLARRFNIPVFFTEATHRAWMRMMRPRKTMTYAAWLDQMEAERKTRAEETARAQAPAHTVVAEMAAAAECGPDERLAPDVDHVGSEAKAAEAEPEETAIKADPAFLPAVEYFAAGKSFSIGEIDVDPFTIPHDAADPCGFVFHARTESIRMAVATDLGYVPPNVKQALKNVDVLLLESNHDLEMLKDGPYPWSVKQRVLSRVGHLSNAACAEFLTNDYDGGAHTIVLGHLSEHNNMPELARITAEQAIAGRMSLLGNRLLLATQESPLDPICL
ncbi:Phosphoribosyl 1,2-cyclic phosphodiesterase [Bryocella elongata]|uniref:Phosphoribosyl 1,2-cyclic phosphodiesterase n=1 Tax=Bryocella elongata TaxID=863522 RepID=A0A1H5ZFV3_9BACT|nr:MBL fold metallo-hydrolase [Bryocella elongata]SEG34625.1 Phosphoribosyl 1,2-cyclic phosphodiesterase [Bryocella elongata]